MKAALDVHYSQDTATAACAVFRHWEDAAPVALLSTVKTDVSAYRSGRFFERELPCLLSILHVAGRRFDSIVIDGYVHLNSSVGKGLGRHLAEALGYPATVVGVAKTPLMVATRFVPVLRGRSSKPLFVSAIGCPLGKAQEWIRDMHGPYRVPTLLKIVDQHARNPARSSTVASVEV